MKTLRKLEISSDKIIKNNELLTLKGGYDGSNCCVCKSVGETLGTIDGASINSCMSDCANQYPLSYGLWNCIV